MASTNKTSLGLNNWVASDKPVRQDFVNDNRIIDENLSKLNRDLYQAGSLSFGYTPGAGSYLNDDAYRPRWIRVGDLVMVFGVFAIGIAVPSELTDLFIGLPKPKYHQWVSVEEIESRSVDSVFLSYEGTLKGTGIKPGNYRLNFGYQAAGS